MAAVLAVGLAGCGGEEESDPNKVIELSGFPGDHVLQGPVYMAQEQDFYAEEDLTYELTYPGSTVRAIQTLVGGETGISWTDAFGVLSAKSQDFDLVAVYGTYQGSGFDFAVAEDSEIQTWDKESLEGKTFGVTAFDGGEVPVLRGALAAAGLTKEGEDYTLKPIGEGGPETAEAVENGDVDVVAGGTHDLAALSSRGVEIRLVTPSYMKQDFPGHIYAVTPEMLEKNREAIVGFLRAHAKGLIWLKENPLCVAKLAMERAPETVGDLDEQGVADFMTKFWIDNNQPFFDESSENYQKFGMQNPEGWSAYQDFLVKAGIEAEDGGTMDQAIDVDDVVSNELIEDVNDFDHEAVAEEARKHTC